MINSFGPNPRMVRMFLAEKGIELPMEQIDLLGGENRQAAYTTKNPGGQTPALELDDGTVIAETVAICAYLEEKFPKGPSLIGSTPEERAITLMNTRRVELNVTENIYNGFRYSEGLGLFKDRMRCLPEAASGLKEKAKDGMAMIDKLLEGKQFICGKNITVADLVLYCCTDFSKDVGQPIDPSFKNVTAWFARVDARPSATASLSPGWDKVGMRG
jgi:glutathione S-transferase